MLEHRDPALSVLLSAAHDANDALAVPRGGGRIYARRETGRPNDGRVSRTGSYRTKLEIAADCNCIESDRSYASRIVWCCFRAWARNQTFCLFDERKVQSR
jgi:hypothetical protein